MRAARQAVAFVILATLLVLGSAMVGRAADASTPRTVWVYGDSLTWESAPYLPAHFPGWTVIVRSFPGLAPCDLLDQLARDTATLPVPDVVVLESAGNSSTPCAQGVVGSPEWRAALTDSLVRFKAAVPTGARLVMAVTPDVQPAGMTLARAETIAAATAAGITQDGYADNAVTPVGFQWTRPCLTSETVDQGCAAGRIVLRTPADGVHFCPAAWTTGAWGLPSGCAVYSSGEYRWARGVAAIVRAQLVA